MIKIVLDTNEYISGVINKQSNPAKIIQAWRRKKVDLIISPSIKEEVERVVRYPKIKDKYHITEGRIKRLLNNLEKYAIKMKDQIKVDVIKKPSDNMFLACAIEGEEDFLITGDNKHILKLKEYQGIKIITPAEFLKIPKKK